MGHSAAKRAASERLNTIAQSSRSQHEPSSRARSALAPRPIIRKPAAPRIKAVCDEPIKVERTSNFSVPATDAEVEEMLNQNEFAVQDAQQFLAQLRRYSKGLQTASKRNNHNALLCEGLYALVMEMLKMYAERRINQHQMVAGLQNMLSRHKQVASALTNLLQVLHSRINKESSPSSATDAQAPHAGYQPSPLQQQLVQKPLPRIGATLEPFPEVPTQAAAQPATSQSSAVTSGAHVGLPVPLLS